NPNELNQDDARYGFRCCHLKNIWTAPLPPETELSRQMTTSTTSIDIMGLQAAYANLHTDQERDYFMQRYHDVISSFGGKTSYDADNRPLLVMRSNHIKFNLTIPLQQLNGLETLVIIMVANKYAFLQITRRRFLNEWEAFKKVISRRNIR